MTPEPAEAQAPHFAALITATPATAAPARRPGHKPLEEVTRSYFGPASDKVATDTGQFDRFGVISPKTLQQSLNSSNEIENQAAAVGIPYHALQPENSRNAHAPRDRRAARGRLLTRADEVIG